MDEHINYIAVVFGQRQIEKKTRRWGEHAEMSDW